VLLEAELLRIFKAVLEIEELRLNDNFFEFGGNSLLAAMLADAIERETGIEMRVRYILQNPTVSSLASFLQTT
jgi:acyl carrier protein